MDKTAWMGVLIPFIGTAAGSAMVFFMKKTMSAGLEKALLGFASGVMIAASVWSLLIPAMEMAEDMPVPTWLPAALALALGIAIQNFPEGAIISMPLRAEGVTKTKAFGLGTMSGVVEPLAALLTIALSSLIESLLPYFLAFAAGAMIYVVIEELIPEAQSGEHSNIATIGAAAGFILMMILDVALG